MYEINTDSKFVMGNNNYFYAFIVVFLAGLSWSFGAVVVRYMHEANFYVFQYLFYRGISIAIILLLYLLYKEGFKFYKNFFHIGLSGILGGLFLATAFTGFIYSITITTAAVTLFMLAAMPFIAAVFSYFILGELLTKKTLTAMIIAFAGVIIMIINDSIHGTILGALLGFISASGFALYTVTLRWKPQTPKFTTVVLAGLFCATFSLFMLNFSIESFEQMPTKNSYLSLLHGLIVATGLILYSLGAKYLPAAELALLSLMEVVGGVLWVWIPLSGINEKPSLTVIIGGVVITTAVIYHGLSSRNKREPVTQ